MGNADRITTAFLPCPGCGSPDVRVSRERGFFEWLGIAVGVQRLRCRLCGTRYVDHPWRWPTVLYARCPRCANLRLRNWQEKYYLPPPQVRLLTYLGWREQRCEACRYNFVSLRPRMRIRKPEAGFDGTESIGKGTPDDAGAEKKNGSK